jgi:EpsI family protein
MPQRDTARMRLILGLTLVFVLQIAAAQALWTETSPTATPQLYSLPTTIGPWKMSGERVMEADVAAYLRPDAYIERSYKLDQDSSDVNLFVAYFQSIRNGYGPHSPAVCLPGSGWMNKGVRAADFPGSGSHPKVPVNEYLLEKDGRNLLVVYWYQNGRRVWADEFRAKLYMLPDLLRYHRSDVALVRLMRAVNPGDLEPSRAAVIDFARQAFPHLSGRFSVLY